MRDDRPHPEKPSGLFEVFLFLLKLFYKVALRKGEKTMAKINFASGHVYESEGAVSVYEAARSLEIISREVLAAKVNGEVTELSTVVDGEADVQLLTYRDPDGAKVFRHTAAHIMAQAVKRLYPSTKQTIGPATDTGYFQDFDSEISFTPDILKNIEA